MNQICNNEMLSADSGSLPIEPVLLVLLVMPILLIFPVVLVLYTIGAVR
jgi:hypothetical protein